MGGKGLVWVSLPQTTPKAQAQLSSLQWESHGGWYKRCCFPSWLRSIFTQITLFR